jgi:hypothetical protein
LAKKNYLLDKVKIAIRGTNHEENMPFQIATYSNFICQQGRKYLMGHYRIICVDYDQNGVITQVGIETNSGTKKCDIDTIADWINSNTNSFYARNSLGQYVTIYAGANLFKKY